MKVNNNFKSQIELKNYREHNSHCTWRFRVYQGKLTQACKIIFCWFNWSSTVSERNTGFHYWFYCFLFLYSENIPDLPHLMLQLEILKMSTSGIFNNRFISLSWKPTICILCQPWFKTCIFCCNSLNLFNWAQLVYLIQPKIALEISTARKILR